MTAPVYNTPEQYVDDVETVLTNLEDWLISRENTSASKDFFPQIIETLDTNVCCGEGSIPID